MVHDWLDDCTRDGSNNERCIALKVVRELFGCTSVILSLFMIFLIWLYKKYLFFTQRLLLSLSIASLFDVMPYIIGPVKSKVGCQIQGYFMTYFDWVCLAWVCVITLNMFRLIKEDTSYESQERLFHLVVWFLPLIIAGVPFRYEDGYGRSGPWCWITSEHKALGFLIWYAPALMIVVVLTIMLIYLRIYTKQQNLNYLGYNPEQERARSRKWKEVRLLFLYPLVYIVLAVIPLIARIHALSSGESSFILVLLMNMTAPLLGAVNTCLYSCNADMRHQIHPNYILDELKHRRSRATTERYDFESETSHIRPYSD